MFQKYEMTIYQSLSPSWRIHDFWNTNSKTLNEKSSTDKTAASETPSASAVTQLVIWQECEHISPFSSTEEK